MPPPPHPTHHLCKIKQCIHTHTHTHTHIHHHPYLAVAAGVAVSSVEAAAGSSAVQLR